MERRLELIGEMAPAIWVHLIAALLALIIGAFVLWRRKGDGRHKLMGRLWVALMLTVAITSFFISTINEDGFSPIHLLSVYTLCSITAGVFYIRKRGKNAKAVDHHKQAMQGLYAGGLLIAGGFTFLPFRLLGRLTFGETLPVLNYVIVGVMVLTGVWLLHLSFKPAFPGQRGKEQLL